MEKTMANGNVSDGAFERETIIRLSDGDSVVSIWTARRTDITAFRKKVAAGRAVEISSGNDGTHDWAEFEVQKSDWSSARGIKTKRDMTPEQKQAAGERLRKARAQS